MFALRADVQIPLEFFTVSNGIALWTLGPEPAGKLKTLTLFSRRFWRTYSREPGAHALLTSLYRFIPMMAKVSEAYSRSIPGLSKAGFLTAKINNLLWVTGYNMEPQQYCAIDRRKWPS